MSSIGKKSLALAVAGVLGSTAITASAAPFLTVQVLGRVQGSGGSFSPSVAVSGGETIEYQIVTTLGAEESVNPYAGATNTATTTTISNWVPSNGSTSPTAGLNQVRFHLDGAGAATFGGPSTAAAGWNDAPGGSGGAPAAGGRLEGVNYIRAAGNFDGVAGTPVANLEADPVPAVLESLIVGTGTFTANSQGVVSPSVAGGTFLDTTVLATMRWRNDANGGNVNYNPSRFQQNNSTTGTAQGGNAVDPIIVYQGLALVPEPATMGLLGLAGVGMLARRRRQA